VTAADPLGWLADAAQARVEAGVHRQLRPRHAESNLLDLASNDYLGLTRDPRVVEAGAAAIRRWGAGSTGSRLVTGTTELHIELEVVLADLVGAASALVFSSGYLANLAAVTGLAGPDCLIVSDAGNHASLVDACRLAKSRVVVTAHGDQGAAERALADRGEPRAVVVLDAINSADGDLLPLAEWQVLARRHGAILVVDDAHGIGVRGNGRGAVHEAGIAGEPNVVTTITLSKSLGAQGGAVLGDAAIREHLIDTGRSFIFDTGLNPAAAGAALQAANIIVAEPELSKAVLTRAAELADAAGVPATDSAVIPVIIGAAQQAYDRSIALRDKGILLGCFRPPSVPVGTARLRLTARATLTDADIELFRQALIETSGP
jgi:8-amino-7-oxononanoate synthase